MKIEQKNIDIIKLINYLLDQRWHSDCEIYKNEKDEIIIKYPNEHNDTYLRYSKGPKQGFSWDIYGDDFQNYELAIIALSKAPIPLNYRKAEYPFKITLAAKKVI